jgi:CRP/FNR family transcriptional regulator
MFSSLVITHVNSLATVIAVTDCSISSFSIDAFKKAIRRNEILREHFIAAQSRELLMMQQYIIMQGEDAGTRLRSLLDEGKCSAWNTTSPSHVLRQSEVANLLAITPEHLSRIKVKPSSRNDGHIGKRPKLRPM